MAIILSNLDRFLIFYTGRFPGTFAVKKSFKIDEYFAKLQARMWLCRALCAPGHHTAKNEESAQDNHVLACNFAKYSPIYNFFH